MSHSTEVQIRRITPDQTIPLRHSVLWPDRPQSYVLLEDDFSDTATHFGAFILSSTVPIGVISLFALPSDDANTASYRFRKFAVDPAHQNRGIGTLLLQKVMTTCMERGASEVWCDARIDACGLYEKFGMYKNQGQGEWVKGGIEYVRMVKQFNSPTNG
ncbi:hypothetical protein G7K_2013-t1 [Saitoella complicata NRRL Y-17804]|uniref:N-acetyltransferase domain-containing protein n=2 Tax=Saitoella complicata (strain BCRC 22490 / CBS 7301 / JCM 7358 / NBRC 10748 / NRRL Y-17804) TaxID=698492 RepID=A0A0E9NEH7_SAICN|nr:hypothetical protein G7K_2013-t1 [Saitoella complicata NRRL Y-17804]